MSVQEKIAQAKASKATKLDLSEMALTVLPQSIAELRHLKQLDLSKNNLQTLPPFIGKLTQLEAINLWSNSLHELPKEFGQLKSLKRLDLEDNHLVDIPMAIFELTELRILDLEHNSILEVNDEINTLSALQQLDISRNKLQKLNPAVCELKQLVLLNLKGNLLTELPSQVSGMQRLKQLIIHGNALDDELVEASETSLKAVSQYFKKKTVLDKIQYAKENELIKLDLSQQDITDIPKGIFEITSLKILGLDSNNIWEVPAEIIKLTNLEVLDLSNNQLVKVPEILDQMPNLKVIETMGNPLEGSGLIPQVEMRRKEVKKRIHDAKNNHSDELDLSDCGLTSVPAQVLQMTHLKRLILGKYYKKEDDFRHRNYITALPDRIQSLSNLQHLDLTGNALQNLPDEISALSSLQSLNISQNQFRQIPEVLYQLKFNLKALDLSYNFLKTLPEQFAALKNLASIRLSFNQIDEFPTVLGKLSNLRCIYIDNNRIETLPEDMGSLSLLQELDLSYNELTELPKSLAKSNNIEKLNISNNKITQLNGNIHLMRFSLLELDASYNNIHQLPVGMRQLIKMKSLNLSHNQLNAFPTDVLELKQLETLLLNHNKIKELPKGLIHLKKLNQLHLSHNPYDKYLVKPIKKGIQGIREWFNFKETLDKIKHAKASNATTLDLSDMSLRSIPREVFEIKSLKILRLGKDYESYENDSLQNSIAHLTKNFTKLVNLEEVYLQHNDISHFPEELLQLKKLKVLNLEYNQLKKLPPAIGEMTTLEYINVNNNQLRDLPFELSKLPHLKEGHWTLNQLNSPFREAVTLDLPSLKLWFAKEFAAQKIKAAQKNKADNLDLSNCMLSEVPADVFEMQHLKHLNLSYNAIPALSKDIQKLSKLETLNVAHNKLESIPASLLKLSRLKNIKYHSNPLTRVPSNIQQQGWNAMQQWLTQQVINDKIDSIIEGISYEEKPLYQRDAVICQVCHGEKELTGKHEHLDVQFHKQTCYGCQGLGLIDYDSEQIHLIIYNAQTHIHRIERRLKTILHQKKAFEESILFAPNTNHNILSEQVKKGFHNILERYTGQLRVLAEQYDFYKNVQKRVHNILYNQYMLFCALDEFRKIGKLEVGLALNFEEKAAMQKDIIAEVNSLNQFVSNANGLMIPEDFTEVVGDLAKRFEAYA